jgi:DNA repair protein RadA/Sms
MGEVGLAGEVRGVQAAKRRMSEAARLGYRRAIVPAGSLDPSKRTTGMIVTDEGMRVMETDAVWSALDIAFAGHGSGA